MDNFFRGKENDQLKSNQRHQDHLIDNEKTSSVQPTDQMIEGMIGDAIRAPSGDNAQPWRFQWTNHQLTIFHCEALAEHSLNRKNHASMLALGALTEALRLSATKYGFLTKLQLVFENRKSLSVWAKINFVSSQVQMDPLAEMIARRTTDRHAYHGGILSSELINEIHKIESDFKDCAVRIQSKQTKEFLDYFLKSEELLWKNSKIVRDLVQWLRLSKHELAGSSDGMSWRNIGINAAEAWIFKLIRMFPAWPGLLWNFGFGLRIRQEGKKAIESSAALLCFTANAVDAESFCNAGAFAYRTWLLLNARGFGVQPLSFSSTTIADLISGVLSHQSTIEERAFFQKGIQTLQENFSLGKNEIPVWIIRTGLSPALPKEQRTLRRPVSELLLPVDVNNGES